MSIVNDVLAELEDLGALGATDESPELVEALDAKPLPRAVVPTPAPAPIVDPNGMAAKLDSGIAILANLLEVFTDIRKSLPSAVAAPQVSVSVALPSVPDAPAAPAVLSADGVPQVSDAAREQAIASALSKIRGEAGSGSEIEGQVDDNVPYVGQERIRPVSPNDISSAQGSRNGT